MASNQTQQASAQTLRSDEVKKGDAQSPSLSSRQSVKPSNPKYDEHFIAFVKAKVEVDTNGCWIWQGFVSPRGYGQVGYRGKRYPAHRAHWIALNGPVLDGYDVCHRCDVRRCVNPEHLFTGTRKQNLDDMYAKGRAYHQKAQCRHGHPWPEHSYYVPRPGGGRDRHCRLCERLRAHTPQYREKHNERQRRRRAEKRAARLEQHA